MRIGFVAEPYEEKNASGMGYVVLELMRNLPAQGRGHDFVFYSSRPISRVSVQGKYENIIIPRGFVRKLLYFLFLKEKPDVLIFMVPMLPLIVRGMKSVPMCQELGSQKIRPEGLREKLFAFFRDQILMRISLARSRQVIAASEATKNDLLKYYRLASKKISVAYDGFQDLSKFSESAPSIDTALTPYFFFVGKVKYRKNVHGIAKAFVEFKRRTNAPAKLVIAGDYGGEYYRGIMETLTEGSAAADAYFAGYVTGAQLYSYYKKALACVFPSLNEGFGMPIIEAMHLGVPVITSNISSMTEVAGDAAMLVNPLVTSEIAGAFEKVYTDANLRAELIQKGKVRAEVFSWPKAAREYITVAERV